MVTLKEVIKLITRLQDDEICYLRKAGTDRLDYQIVSVKEIRDKYDMQQTKVIGIAPKFDFEGDYVGIEFEIQ